MKLAIVSVYYCVLYVANITRSTFLSRQCIQRAEDPLHKLVYKSMILRGCEICTGVTAVFFSKSYLKSASESPSNHTSTSR
jgi:hypothetical protein